MDTHQTMVAQHGSPIHSSLPMSTVRARPKRVCSSNMMCCVHLDRVGTEIAAEGNQEEIALEVVPPQLPGSYLRWRQHLWQWQHV